MSGKIRITPSPISKVGARAGDDAAAACGVQDRPVEVPADDPAHVHKARDPVTDRDPIRLGEPDRVEGPVAGPQRRVVQRDHRRRPGGGIELGLEPGQPLRPERASLLPG